MAKRVPVIPESKSLSNEQYPTPILALPGAHSDYFPACSTWRDHGSEVRSPYDLPAGTLLGDWSPCSMR
ncbi:hypothetical protein CC2G_014220 [Coprinopsis cinerea AmutBmut pab1-1]|nr:hypothetical protein CC2G_014220 [Coprinopsis cinerea AmutBmut pab1-1]